MTCHFRVSHSIAYNVLWLGEVGDYEYKFIKLHKSMNEDTNISTPPQPPLVIPCVSRCPSINFFNVDCIEFMKSKPDKCYDLAIVDPPYGIGADNLNMAEYMNGKKLKNGWTKKPTTYKKGNWDSEQPTEEYWNELFRVSKKQIIWGGNHFDLGPSRGYLIWDKLVGFKFSTSMCEMAWTNCINNVKKFTYKWSGFVQGNNGNKREQRIHPTQKPIALYRWLLLNYAKQEYKIIDTHGGSFSHAIAAEIEGFDLDICEIDKEYFQAGVNAFNLHKRQQQLF